MSILRKGNVALSNLGVKGPGTYRQVLSPVISNTLEETTYLGVWRRLELKVGLSSEGKVVKVECERTSIYLAIINEFDHSTGGVLS